jgi:sugar-specific transcriptional regulator TrmB
MKYNNTVKKEKDVFKKDITEDEASYAYYLKNNKEVIDNMFASSSSTQDMIKKIIEIISPAHDTPAKRNFTNKLVMMRDKTRVLEYYYNAMLNGSGLGVI